MRLEEPMRGGEPTRGPDGRTREGENVSISAGYELLGLRVNQKKRKRDEK